MVDNLNLLRKTCPITLMIELRTSIRCFSDAQTYGQSSKIFHCSLFITVSFYALNDCEFFHQKIIEHNAEFWGRQLRDTTPAICRVTETPRFFSDQEWNTDHSL